MYLYTCTCILTLTITLTLSDMSFNLWDTEQEEALVQQCEHHTEFVVGLDFNIFVEGQVASCAWDESLCVWHLGQQP